MPEKIMRHESPPIVGRFAREGIYGVELEEAHTVGDLRGLGPTEIRI
jgi:hypothetical protein